MNAKIDGQLLGMGVGLVLWLSLAVQVVGIWLQPHQTQSVRQQCAIYSAQASR